MPIPERSALRHRLVALALALLATCLWSLTRHYRALSGDAELYALQAMARLHPALGSDLYLQNVSQDRYTLFSPLYAWLIERLGLHAAQRDLFVACTATFLAASWALARRLSGEWFAWAAVALLTVMVGRYGAYSVFRFAEDFLTARTAAEALVAVALACWFTQRQALGLAIAAVALLIHPLMALPGLLVIGALAVSPRLAAAAAGAGILGAALVAALAHWMPQADGPLALIDGDWLTVVRERSQFLFLQLWRFGDWKNNALPFAALGVTLLAARDLRVRRLAIAAVLVGATGLAIAAIASTTGPVAILLQGQAWRWVWIPGYVSILLLPATLRALWEDARTGPVCAVILLAGWTCAAVDIWNSMALVAALWLVRPLVGAQLARLLRASAVMIAVVLVAWALAAAWAAAGLPSLEGPREPAMLALLRNVLSVQAAALLVGAVAWWLVTRLPGPWSPAIAVVALGLLAALTVPRSLAPVTTAGTPDEIRAFADWRAAMPADADVAVIGVHNATAFVWFTLDRPNYLSIDQSSGVVFSRRTAAEVRRRSQVLEPLVEPSWKIMTYLARRAANGNRDVATPDRPLTAPLLVALCRDATLGFVVAREDVGFGALRHAGAGAYQDWYLYDCRRVRAAGAAA